MPRHDMKVIGLMSGTSGDGVDAAVVHIRARGRSLRVVPMAWATYPYPPRLRGQILRASLHGSVEQICHLNVVLGELFARAALRVLRAAGLRVPDVDVIGSHGQTVHHRPEPIREPGVGLIRSTLQLADPCVIAERTGITTVANFRLRDMAAGGQGAPLTPYAHHVLFADPHRSRLIVNLGGISNVTYLPAGGGLEEIRAFDTGPGNMILDALIQRLTHGRQAMDRDGRLAAKGGVDSTVLTGLLAHPFVQRRPPKSTGREEFGETVLDSILRAGQRKRLAPADLLATSSRFTAEAVGLARRWLSGPVDEVIVGGGGVRNRKLMADLALVFDPTPVRTFEDAGWDSKAFEAVAFAVMAYQTVHGEPANVPAATGARRPVVLGTITPGERATLWMH